MIEAFVIDIDGTFIDTKGNIPPENLSALEAIEESGIEIFFASGRMLSSVMKLQSLRLRRTYPIIAYNGAVVWNGRDIIFNENIPSRIAVDIIRYSLSKGLYIHAYVNDELIVPYDCKKAREYAKHSSVEYRVEKKFIEFISENAPTKLLIIDKPGQIEKLSVHFSFRYPDLNVFRSFATYLDLLPAGIHKGVGLRYLCENLHIDPAHVVAFGDNDNDIPLFEEVGFSVAVANATTMAKKTADVIAPTNDEAGFGKVAMKLVKLMK